MLTPMSSVVLAETKQGSASKEENEAEVVTTFGSFEQVSEKFKENDSKIELTIEDLKQFKLELIGTGKDIRTNESKLDNQKSLIENNSIRLYELLIRMKSESDKIDQTVDTLHKKMQNVRDENDALKLKMEKKENKSKDNRFWMLLSIVLVSLTPVAFALSRTPNLTRTESSFMNMGNLAVWASAFLGYFLVGFSLMYGSSPSNWLGNFHFGGFDPLAPITAIDAHTLYPQGEFFLLQVAFVVMLSLIIFNTLADRLTLRLHIIIALLMAMFVFPLFGHWAWASYFLSDHKGWLESLGFIDVAGATVVHSIAAWFSLLLVLIPSPNKKRGNAHKNAITYSAAGVFILWLAWFGFIAGGLSISNEKITHVLFNISLAAIASGLSSLLISTLIADRSSYYARGLAGFVSGLVAIAATGHLVTPHEALLIGLIAGIVQNLAFFLLTNTLLPLVSHRNAATLIAIHGFAGVWGTISVALFMSTGTLGTIDIAQLSIQLQGIFIAFAISIIAAVPIMILRLLRV